MLSGILSVLLGVWLAKNPENIAVYIGIVAGLWIIVSSWGGLKLAFALRRTGAPWILLVIMNVLDILVGCAVLYSPVLTSLSLTMGLGIVLIVHAVINIVDMFVLKKNARDVEKLIVEKEKAQETAAAAEPEAEVSEG